MITSPRPMTAIDRNIALIRAFGEKGVSPERVIIALEKLSHGGKLSLGRKPPLKRRSPVLAEILRAMPTEFSPIPYDAIYLDRALVSKSMQKLVERGLVERGKPLNSRGQTYRITANGLDMRNGGGE